MDGDVISTVASPLVVHPHEIFVHSSVNFGGNDLAVAFEVHQGLGSWKGYLPVIARSTMRSILLSALGANQPSSEIPDNPRTRDNLLLGRRKTKALESHH